MIPILWAIMAGEIRLETTNLPKKEKTPLQKRLDKKGKNLI